jgi:hypothetical protein
VPTDDFAQLSLQFVDQTQWRYEVIRPLVLFADRTPRQRANETDTHPATVRTLTRRFRQQGMVGLLPEDVEVSIRARTLRVPEAVREELDRLKALYDGFRYRELARILFITCGVSVDHKTVKALWQASGVSCQGHLGLWDYHAHPTVIRPACGSFSSTIRGAKKSAFTGFCAYPALECPRIFSTDLDV